MDGRSRHDPDRPASGISRGMWVLLGFLAVAGYFLLTEHRAHAFAFLPYLLVLACPLMHLFHRHGGHGSHQAQAGGGKGREPSGDRTD